MENQRIPRPGEIYKHFKNKLYQIITVAKHTETGEQMVVYQALYQDYKTYVRPLTMFISEVDHEKYPEVIQKYRFERWEYQDTKEDNTVIKEVPLSLQEEVSEASEEALEVNAQLNKSESVDDQNSDEGTVNSVILEFLDATSYTKKLDILTSNRKHLTDRLINDMAASLDCTIDDGTLEDKIRELINCLQAMIRFEDRRLR